MLDLIELVPVEDRKEWINANLEQVIDRLNGIFRNLAIASSYLAEMEGTVRHVSEDLLYLETQIIDLESLRHESPA